MTTQLTDKDLLAELKKSYLDKLHKDHFANLIPAMSTQDRNKFMDLIKESHKVNETKVKADAQYQEELVKLNAEFDQKISAMEKELTNYILGEYKQMEAKESEEELEKIEAEIGKL
jgi:CRISPR/Cas system Type II protein with McrA/HNH and RuvC-like nuclease domain